MKAFIKFPRASPGDDEVTIDPQVWNDLVTVVEQQQRLSVSGLLKLTDGPEGKTISALAQPKPLYQITGNASLAGAYTAKLIQLTTTLDPSTSGTFTAADIGTQVGNTCYFVNEAEAGSSSWALTAPATVEPSCFYGKAADGKEIYLFNSGGAGGISAIGQYEYMVFQNTAMNAVGFDWVRAHPMI